MQAARQDTPAWMKGFLDTFYNIEPVRCTLVSDQAYQASWNLAVTASATRRCRIPTWETDFRADLPGSIVPMLIIQGDDDQVCLLQDGPHGWPACSSDVQTVVIAGGPHAIGLDPRRAGQHALLSSWA